jgi:hypothetical protein
LPSNNSGVYQANLYSAAYWWNNQPIMSQITINGVAWSTQLEFNFANVAGNGAFNASECGVLVKNKFYCEFTTVVGAANKNETAEYNALLNLAISSFPGGNGPNCFQCWAFAGKLQFTWVPQNLKPPVPIPVP